MTAASKHTARQLADLLESHTCGHFTIDSKSLPGGYHYRIVKVGEAFDDEPYAPTAYGAGQALLMVRAFASGFTARLFSPEPDQT